MQYLCVNVPVASCWKSIQLFWVAKIGWFGADSDSVYFYTQLLLGTCFLFGVSQPLGCIALRKSHSARWQSFTRERFIIIRKFSSLAALFMKIPRMFCREVLRHPRGARRKWILLFFLHSSGFIFPTASHRMTSAIGSRYLHWWLPYMQHIRGPKFKVLPASTIQPNVFCHLHNV